MKIWSDTPPGRLAIIAQLSLEDPRYDAFYKAAGVTLVDPYGKVVFPDGKQSEDRTEEAPEAHQRTEERDRLSPDARLEPEGSAGDVDDEEGADPPEEGGVFGFFGG